jgi:hypothetical protein
MKLFHPSMFLQSESNSDGWTIIWPTNNETGLDRFKDTTTILYKGQHCVCHHHIAYSSIQCKKEFIMNGWPGCLEVQSLLVSVSDF